MTFYVYEHWRPDKGVPFYVGKGSGRRAWDVRRRSEEYLSIIRELSCSDLTIDVRVVADGLTGYAAFVLEIERIAFWRSLGISLANKTNGGQGHAHTAETRAKMSASRKGNKYALGFRHSQETIEKRRAANKGFRHTDESRTKMSAVQKGRTVSEEQRANISAAKKGKRHSEETRAKVMAALERGRAKANGPKSLEVRARISASLTGKRLSLETRAKLSAAAKEQWTRQKLQLALS